MKKYVVSAIITAMMVAVFCSKKVTVVTEQQEPPKNDIAMVFPEEEPQKAIPEKPKKEIVRQKRTVIVYFGFDSYALDNFEQTKLNDVNATADIVGGCCPIGTDDYNYTLGLHRAIVVRDILEDNGIKVKSFKSVGERELVTTDKNRYNLNRRCEITF